MLENSDVVANLAVSDMSRARQFYEDTLGLKPIGSGGDEYIVYKSGNTSLSLYRSDCAGTNQATAVTWSVDDMDGVIRELRAKGVTFEHYDMPEMTREGDVYVEGDMKVAWFKDPDGNILAIANQ